MSKLIVNEIEKYDAGQLTITTGTDVSVGSNLTVGGTISGTLSTAAQPNITSVGTLSSLAVSGNLTVDTNTLYVDAANNRVGIGTSSAAVKLHIRETSAASAIFLDSTATTDQQNRIASLRSTGGAYSTLLIDANTHIFRTGTTERLRIDSSGRVGINSNPDGTGILAIKQTTDVTNGGLVILATDGTGAVISRLTDGGLTFRNGGSERMRITSAGNVGIGTSSPAYSLEIYDGASRVIRAGASFVSIDSTGSASAPSLIIDGDDNTGFWHPASDTLAISTAGTERMRIDASGRLGIGTSSPTAPLTVAGPNGLGTLPALGTFKTAVFSNAANTTDGVQVYLVSGNTGNGTLYFGDTDDGDVASIRYDHSNNSMQFETADSERMRITSSGRVGIGTSSPSEDLQVSSATDTIIAVETTGTGAGANAGIKILSVDGGDFLWQTGNATGNALRLFDLNASAERLRIDASGNVGIGVVPDANASGYTSLQIHSKTSTTIVPSNYATNIATNAYVGTDGNWKSGGGSYKSALYSSFDGYHAFYTTSSTATVDTTITQQERMRINSAGNVGIGTSSPATNLEIYKSDYPTFRLSNANAFSNIYQDLAGAITYSSDDGATAASSGHLFYVDGSEKLRIDSSGNLLVSTTNADPSGSAVTGTRIGDGYVISARSGGYTADFGRTDSGGELIRFRQGGNTVGFINASATGASIYLGGTAAANALDDYEEGTFTPTADGNTTAGTTTYLIQNGYYTKIGRQVTVTLTVQYSAMTGTGALRIGGLPFTILNSTQHYPVGSMLVNELNWTSGSYLVPLGFLNTTFMIPYCLADNATSVAQDCVDELVQMRITMTYFTS